MEELTPWGLIALSDWHSPFQYQMCRERERDPKKVSESKVEEEMSTNKKALEWSVVFCDIIALQEPYEIGVLGTWVPNSLSSLIAYFWFH
ncbi:hypothetical protein TIFTF001_017923 [Ficus carica]|uniref:Uncharacterized protein n=1 Tax=Ficus carica TaxID=3494 RepID=A0AA88DB75_FICCA|nr:hypothetical protein TIFTF001_017923 [Ficus carica]